MEAATTIRDDIQQRWFARVDFSRSVDNHYTGLFKVVYQSHDYTDGTEGPVTKLAAIAARIADGEWRRMGDHYLPCGAIIDLRALPLEDQYDAREAFRGILGPISAAIMEVSHESASGSSVDALVFSFHGREHETAIAGAHSGFPERQQT